MLDLSPVARLSYRSLARPVWRRQRYLRQTSCMGHFAELSLAFEPTDTFAIDCPAPPRGLLPPELFEGVLEGLRGRKTEEPFAGLRVTILDAKVHIIDSRPLSFRIAALQAIEAAFEEAGCLRLGRDFV